MMCWCCSSCHVVLMLIILSCCVERCFSFCYYVVCCVDVVHLGCHDVLMLFILWCCVNVPHLACHPVCVNVVHFVMLYCTHSRVRWSRFHLFLSAGLFTLFPLSKIKAFVSCHLLLFCFYKRCLHICIIFFTPHWFVLSVLNCILVWLNEVTRIDYSVSIFTLFFRPLGHDLCKAYDQFQYHQNSYLRHYSPQTSTLIELMNDMFLW